MSFFKKISRNVRKTVRKVVPKPKAIKRSVSTAFRKPIGRVRLPPGSPVGIARRAARNLGDALSDTAEDVVRGTKTAVETTGAFIADTEHFMKTGDWGRAVEKLQAEEADAEAKMYAARAAFDEALAVYARTVLKRRSLSIVHEKTAGPSGRHGGAQVPPQHARPVNPDLYGSDATRLLDAAGLEVIGDAGRALQKLIPVRTPIGLLRQQSELARARELLRKNITTFRRATADTTRATANVIDATEDVAAEVAALEADFIARGVDPATGSTRDMADAAEDAAKRELASDLLKAGLAVEDVARATELDPAAVQVLADAA